jgi:hypothetical protein
MFLILRRMYGIVQIIIPQCVLCERTKTKKTKLRGLSVSELYRASGRRLLAKLVPTFADRGCHVVSATDPRGR